MNSSTEAENKQSSNFGELSTKPVGNAKRYKKLLALGPFVAILPAIVLVSVFLAYPIAYGFWLSVQDVTLFDLRGGTFVGLANYAEIMGNPSFQNSMWRTMIFVFGVIALGMVQSLGFGLLLHKIPTSVRFLRALSLIPFFISSIAVAMIFRFFVQSEGGFTGIVGEALNLPFVSWLGDPSFALVVVVVASVWTFAPFSVLLILSGLQTVNEEMYDAAKIDGANNWQTFFYITLPSIRPQIVTSLIWLTFQAFNSFGLILALTGGGPGRATELLAVYMYGLGLQSLDIAGSSAVMIIILALNAIFSFIYLKLLPQEEPAR
jgi:ABC-type sugar transport system permease subunit